MKARDKEDKEVIFENESDAQAFKEGIQNHLSIAAVAIEEASK